MTADDQGPAPLDIAIEGQVLPVEDRPPVTRRLSAWWLVLALAVVGFALLVVDQLRHAVMVLGVALWVGAALRAVLPEERAGGLVVRSRVLDVIVLLVLGAGIVLAGLTLRSR